MVKNLHYCFRCYVKFQIIADLIYQLTHLRFNLNTIYIVLGGFYSEDFEALLRSYMKLHMIIDYHSKVDPVLFL